MVATHNNNRENNLLQNIYNWYYTDIRTQPIYHKVPQEQQ